MLRRWTDILTRRLNRWPFYLTAFLILILGAAWYVISLNYQAELLSNERLAFATDLTLRNKALTAALDRRLSLLQGLKSYAEATLEHGELFSQDEFEKMADGLYQGAQGIHFLAIAPGNLIKFVYPSTGNGLLLSLDLEAGSSPEMQDGVKRALANNQLTLAGPVTAGTNTIELLAQVPINFREQSWGIAMVGLDMQTMISEAGLDMPEGKWSMALRASSGWVYYGSANIFANNPIVQKVFLPDGSWDLAGEPQEGWLAGFQNNINTFRLMGWLVILMLGLVVYLVSNRQRRLVIAVSERTAELNSELEQRKRSEAQIRQLSTALEAAANAVMITSRSGEIAWVNPAFTILTGYSQEEAIGQNPRFLQSGSQPDGFYEGMWETILTGKVWHGELVNRRKDGTLYTEEMTIAPVRSSADGEITHFIAIKQDVTHRIQHEREQDAVVAMTTALRTVTSRERILEITLAQVQSLMKASGAAVFGYSYVNREVICEQATGVCVGWVGQVFRPPIDGIGNSLMNGVPMVVSDWKNADNVRGWPDFLGCSRSSAAVPMISNNMIFGVLWVSCEENFTEDEMRILTALSDITAGVLRQTSLIDEANRRVKQLDSLRKIDLAIATNHNLTGSMSVLLDQTLARLQADAADVLVVEDNGSMKCVAARGFRSPDFMKREITLDGSCPGQVLRERYLISGNCEDGCKNAVCSLRLKGENFISYNGVPIIFNDQVMGVIEVFERKSHRPDPDWHNFLFALAGQAAIGVQSSQLVERLQRSNIELAAANTKLTAAYDTTLEGWALTVELRDTETMQHIRRLPKETVKLGRRLGMNDEELINVRRGAMLHDIGKLAIPDEILLSNKELSEKQWQEMRKHPEMAQKILSQIDFLAPALDIPYCHHERWDGHGYPRGLKGEEIPLAARIFSVVDVYDALSHTRRYRTAWSEQDVLSYIKDESGHIFDPQVVEEFLQMKLEENQDPNTWQSEA